MDKRAPNIKGVRAKDWLKKEADNLSDNPLAGSSLESLKSKKSVNRSFSIELNFLARILNRLAGQVDPKSCVDQERLDDFIANKVFPFAYHLLKQREAYLKLFEQGMKELDAAVENILNQEKSSPIRIFAGTSSPNQEEYLEWIEMADSADLSELVRKLNGFRVSCSNCLNRTCENR